MRQQISARGTTDIIATGFNPGLEAILFLTSAQGYLGKIELDAEEVVSLT
jgi:hypothetical protein